jgi:type I restriction enzyme S subunit
LPKGWATALLKEIVLARKGKKPDVLKNESKEGYIPYLDIRAIETNEIRQYADAKTSRIGTKADLLVVWDGARSGWVGLGQNGAIGSTIMALKPRVGELKYLQRWLQGQFSIINTNTRGTGIPHVDPEVFLNLEVPLPPHNEQHRIVAKLEEMLAKVDDCQKRLAKIPIILKRFRQAVLAVACSGRLTADWREMNPDVAPASTLISAMQFRLAEPVEKFPELPEFWQWVALGNYGRCSRGRFSVRPRNDPNYFGGIHPFIQIGNLPSEGGWISSHTQTLNEKGLAVSKKYQKGTVVIAIVGATIGNTGLLSYDMCFTDSMVGIETGTPEGNRYVELFLRHKKEEIRQGSYSSGGQPNINLEFLNPYPFALPPLDEQREIVRRVESFFTLADQLEASYSKAKAHVDRLTQSILYKAFRGELVPQNENDEPASVLLERIRAQRNEPTQAKRSAVPMRPKKLKLPEEPEPLPLAAEPPVIYAATIPQRILTAMKHGKEYIRADITAEAGISDTEWIWAIRQLKDEGKVRQIGERRGARYLVTKNRD